MLDGVVDYLPDPSQVENVAIDTSGSSQADGGEGAAAAAAAVAQIRLNPERSNQHPFVGLAFKLEQGKFGQLTYLRVYQGEFKKGESLYNTRTGKKTRVPRLARMHADKMEDLNVAKAGDICALFGVDCASGDSFVAADRSGSSSTAAAAGGSSKAPPQLSLSLESIFVPDPVISMSLKLQNKKDSDNLSKAMQRFTKEDPTFRVSFDNDSKETIVSGMGELHLEIYAQRMEREYGCPVILGKPKVAFRETLLRKVPFDYWHRKQSGGRGEYARVIGYLEPLPAHMNTTVEFSDKTVGTNVPKNFVPGVRKGFTDYCEKGDLSGNRIVGVRFVLEDGAHHEVDSSDWAFYQAAQFAMSDCFEDGTWLILEPIMKVEVTGPIEFQGPCVTMLTKRRGIIVNVDSSEGWFTAEAEAPLNQMFGFATALRSATQGKGEYSMEYSRYAPCDAAVQDEVVAEHRASLGQQGGSDGGGSGPGGKKKKKN